MTKKDYKLIASAFQEALRDPNTAGRETSGIALVARKLAFKLAGENDRFDSNKFLQACGCGGAVMD